MRHRRLDERGFTLIELMIVVGIFGLLVAIAAPGVSGLMGGNRLLGASNTLVADLHYARTLASAQRKTFKIEFHAGDYTLVQASPRVTISTRPLPAGVTCTASDTATFFAWGLTDPVVVTMGGSGTTKTIRISAAGDVTRD